MHYFTDKRFLYSFVSGVVYLCASFVIQSYAVAFATESASNSVTDVILSNTPVLNVDGFFVYGALLLTILIAAAAVSWPGRAPFILKSGALFVAIRAFFVSLTHISPFPQAVVITPNFVTHLFPALFTGKDLFFSGHTGAPFLMALIFWDIPFLRYLFLGFSILFAFVVLMGHLHYSIDVASAYFITYAIFALAQKCFPSDWTHVGQR